jgi:hypothetical protein
VSISSGPEEAGVTFVSELCVAVEISGPAVKPCALGDRYRDMLENSVARASVECEILGRASPRYLPDRTCMYPSSRRRQLKTRREIQRPVAARRANAETKYVLSGSSFVIIGNPQFDGTLGHKPFPTWSVAARSVRAHSCSEPISIAQFRSQRLKMRPQPLDKKLNDRVCPLGSIADPDLVV